MTEQMPNDISFYPRYIEDRRRIKMSKSALMIKITDPTAELYEIKAISDEEVRLANINFIKSDLPYRVCRHEECVLHRGAA